MTQPPNKKRSSAVFWLGCLSVFFVVSLVVVGGTMFWMLRRNTAAARRPSALPTAWRDSVRAWGQLPPEVALLAPARTDSGNAWLALRQLEPFPARWNWLQRLLEAGRDLDGLDSADLAEVFAGDKLDRVAAAAYLRDFSWAGGFEYDEGLDSRIGASIPIRPGMFTSGRAVRGLALRAYLNARRGRRVEAVRDLRAAIGLAAMLYERGSYWIAGGTARSQLADAAQQLAAVSGPRDTATARAAERLVEWARGRRQRMPFLFFDLSQEVDTALSVAADTTLPLPFRADVLWQAALGSVLGDPWHAIRGPRDDVIAGVRRLQRDTDPDLAALAVAADTALARIRRVGWWRRLRLVVREAEGRR